VKSTDFFLWEKNEVSTVARGTFSLSSGTSVHIHIYVHTHITACPKNTACPTPPPLIPVPLIIRWVNVQVQLLRVVKVWIYRHNFRHLNEREFTRWYFGCPYSWARLLLRYVFDCDTLKVYVLQYAENPDCLETCDINFVCISGRTCHCTFSCSVSPINWVMCKRRSFPI